MAREASLSRTASLPHANRTYKNLDGLLVGSTYTGSKVPRSFRGTKLFLPENGIEPEVFPIAPQWPAPRDRFRFVSVGRLSPLKGFDMIIEAMAGSPKPAQRRVDDHRRGSGTAPRSRTRCSDHGLDDNGVPAGLAAADRRSPRSSARAKSFVFASVKDFGGGAVLEAMASGLPCVVVDYGGPGGSRRARRPDSGCRWPRGRSWSRASARAMERLVDDHELCARLGRTAAETVRAQFTWDAKADRIVSFYDEVLGRASGTRSVRGTGPRLDLDAW